MAIFHLHGQIIKRSAGRSAVACAAYRSGETLYDERLGKVFDYTRKHEVEESVILGPRGMPEWLRDREALWNAVEAAERINGQPAREFDLALPIELVRANPRAAKELAKEWAFEMFVIHGLIVDIAFHDMQSGNPHAHVMVTTRPLRSHACEFQPGSHHVFGKKARHLNDRVNMHIWRWNWACAVNEALEVHEIDARIDHRSFAEQGITDREPGIHVGPEATAMWLERGIESDRWTQNGIIWWNNERDWFEENDRYVAFLDEEAAKERALDEQAQSDLNKRDAFNGLAERLTVAATTALSSRSELLNAASDRGRAAAKNLVESRAALAAEVSADIERAPAAARAASGQLNLLSAGLGRSAADIREAAQDRLSARGRALTAAVKKGWHRDCNRVDQWSDRLNVVGGQLRVEHGHRLKANAARLDSLTERLDGAVSEFLDRGELQASDLARRLGELPRRLRAFQACLEHLAERGSPARALAVDMMDCSSRLETQTKRLSHAVRRILSTNERRLDHLVERLEEVRPSTIAKLVEAARIQIRNSTGVMVGTASTAMERSRQLASGGADRLIASLRSAGERFVAISSVSDTQERARTPQHDSSEEKKDDQAKDEGGAARLEDAALEHAISLLQLHAHRGYLPAKREKDGLVLDVEALPGHLASLAPYAAHPTVRELLEIDEGKRGEELMILLGNSNDPLISRDGRGELVANLELFPPQLRAHAAAMIRSDPLLLQYAQNLVERQSAHKVAPTARSITPTPSKSFPTSDRGVTRAQEADQYDVARAYQKGRTERGR